VSRNGANGKRNGKENPQKKPRLPAHLVAGNPGNSGGKKGRSGRKSNDFVAECGRLTDEYVLPKVMEYLRTHSPSGLDPTWRWCAEYVSGYGKGKPTQPVSGASNGDPIKIIVTREPAFTGYEFQDGDLDRDG
jgi:hypothetical protein